MQVQACNQKDKTKSDSRISWPAFADAGYNTLQVVSVVLGSSEAKNLPIADEIKKNEKEIPYWLKTVPSLQYMRAPYELVDMQWKLHPMRQDTFRRRKCNLKGSIIVLNYFVKNSFSTCSNNRYSYLRISSSPDRSLCNLC